MFKKSLITVFVALLALAIPAACLGRRRRRSSSRRSPKTTARRRRKLPPKAPEGGLFAVKDGHLNQLTENPADTEPSFSPDGRTIAFVREGDIFAIRPDGSGQRRLTSGAELDSRPQISPNGRYRRLRAAAPPPARPRDLYTVSVTGGGRARDRRRPATSTKPRSRPTASTIAFVRTTPRAAAPTTTSTRSAPAAAKPAPPDQDRRPRRVRPPCFAGGIVYSRGENSEGPSAYADIYTMRHRRQAKPQGDRRRRLGLRRRRDRQRPHDPLPPRPGPLGEADRRQGPQALRAAGQARRQQRLLLRRQAGRDLHRNPRRTVSSRRSTSPPAASSYAEVVGYSSGEVTTTIGPIVAWQPVPHRQPTPQPTSRRFRPPSGYNGRVGDFSIGSEVAGYRIEELIARGGMGVVYRATHLGLERPVALKVIARELADRDGFRERFLRESRLAARLDHPSVVPVYDSREVDGELIVAMRLVKGGDLRRLIDREGPLPPAPRARPARPGRRRARRRPRRRHRPPRRQAPQHPRRRRPRLPLGLRPRQGLRRERRRQQRLGRRHRPLHVAGAVARRLDRPRRRRLLARLRPLRGDDRHRPLPARAKPTPSRRCRRGWRRRSAARSPKTPRDRYRSAGALIAAARAAEGSEVRPTAVLSHDRSERTTVPERLAAALRAMGGRAAALDPRRLRGLRRSRSSPSVLFLLLGERAARASRRRSRSGRRRCGSPPTARAPG